MLTFKNKINIHWNCIISHSKKYSSFYSSIIVLSKKLIIYMELLQTIIRRTKFPSIYFKQMIKRSIAIFTETDINNCLDLLQSIQYEKVKENRLKKKKDKTEINTYKLWKSSCFINENLHNKMNGDGGKERVGL